MTIHKSEKNGSKRSLVVWLLGLLLLMTGACVTKSARDTFEASLAQGDLMKAAEAMGWLEPFTDAETVLTSPQATEARKPTHGNISGERTPRGEDMSRNTSSDEIRDGHRVAVAGEDVHQNASIGGTTAKEKPSGNEVVWTGRNGEKGVKRVSSGANVAVLRAQFDAAQTNAALLERGYRQINDEDFEGMRQTWEDLNTAAADWRAHLTPPGRRWGTKKAIPWNADYLNHFEGEMAKLKKSWDEAEEEFADRTADEIRQAATNHRWREAEQKLQALRDLERDVTVLEQRVLFEQHLVNENFEKAESLLRILARTDEDTKPLRTRLRNGIREALEKNWAGQDYRAVAGKCHLLNRIGDNTEDIASRLLEVYLSEQDVYLRGMSVRLDGGTKSPDFTVEKEKLVEFAQSWKGIFETIDDGRRGKGVPNRVALLEQLQQFWELFPEKTFLKHDFWEGLDNLTKQAQGLPEYWERYISRVCQLIIDLLNFQRKWYLYDEGKATVGLMTDGRMHYWVRCSPANFHDDEHLEYQCDMLKVHLCGYVKEVQRGVGKGSIYWVEGFDGGQIEVDTDYAAPGVGDLVYVLGTTSMQKGRVHHIQEFESHLPVMDLAGMPTEDAPPTLYDVRYWMNFEYDFMLENLFRRFACLRLGKRLPVLSYGEWDAGRRTTVPEVEAFFHPDRAAAHAAGDAGM